MTTCSFDVDILKSEPAQMLQSDLLLHQLKYVYDTTQCVPSKLYKSIFIVCISS